MSTGTETPFVRTQRGKIHIQRCGVSGPFAKPVSLQEVVDRYGADAAKTRGAYAVLSAQCCGAAPAWWLWQNHRDLITRSEALS